MWLIDRMYLYCYAMLLRSPSRRDALETAALCVAFIFELHFLGIAILLSALSPFNIMGALGKVGIAVIALMIIGALLCRFIYMKRGRFLIEQFAHKARLPRSALIGVTMNVWSFLFLVLCVGLLILIRPSHH